MIDATNLTKLYRRGTETIRAVDSVSFTIEAGAFVALVGPSGAGKTTLLQLIGGMDTPTSGTLRVDGLDLTHLSDRALTQLRGERLGFVFQQFGLLPMLTVAENVALPSLLAGKRRGTVPVDALLERVGLTPRKSHRPGQLSGGEMQRVAIARALANQPRLLLADEPTGNLDATTGASILALFSELHASGLTIVVVTHNPEVAATAQYCLTLRDGKLA